MRLQIVINEINKKKERIGLHFSNFSKAVLYQLCSCNGDDLFPLILFIISFWQFLSSS